MSCNNCIDSNGDQIYPYYGLAPHKHDYKDGEIILGSSTVLPKSDWPDNFEEEPGQIDMGTYTHCLDCGGGLKAVEESEDVVIDYEQAIKHCEEMGLKPHYGL